MDVKKKTVLPLISTVQKIALYGTKSRFYLVGSNNTQTKFRVLKIDRTEPRELLINDDKIEYTNKEIRDLLMMIDVGNRSRNSQHDSNGLSRTVSAFGIIGFVRFLEGYYLILLTKRRRVAIIGHHTIFKIEDTSMIYIPNESVRIPHRDETKYVKMFQNIDLGSNFYFSYSYDISHTLQFNLTAPGQFLRDFPKSDTSFNVMENVSKTLPVWNPENSNSKPFKNSTVEVAQNFLTNLQKSSHFYSDRPDSPLTQQLWSELRTSNSRRQSVQSTLEDEDKFCYGVSTDPHDRFVWNSYLLSCVKNQIHQDWVIHMIHGYVSQSNISVYGRPIYLTLIGRRSNRYAGTRFLKRGANSNGDVANEVETEQIVHDSSVSCFKAGNYTSYVQLRGSIPSYWSQDIGKIVPKPPIFMMLSDPFCYVPGLHFNNLFERYGAPVTVLNLVKKREKKKQESLLSEGYRSSIEYLNMFLPEDSKIELIECDMARLTKLKEVNVIHRLVDIATKSIKVTGIFHNKKSFYGQNFKPVYHGMKNLDHENGMMIQTGVIRVNCVDCLDRTNTAQYAICKSALAFQLYALGVLKKPELQMDTDCMKMLEEVFECHGDTMALQYGGSQLVHRIKGYRKIAPMSSHTRDIMQTLSRYYSNAFSDSDKQNAINLFLGTYVPEDGKAHIWDLVNDFRLHNSRSLTHLACHRRPYSRWWDDDVKDCLPKPAQLSKKFKVLEVVKTHHNDMRTDGFFEHYRPYEFSVLSDLYELTVSNTYFDYGSNHSSDCGPFTVRMYPHAVLPLADRNPSLSGASSTSSAGSSSCSGEDTDLDQEPLLSDTEFSSLDSPSANVSFKKLFSTMKQTYGVELKNPSRSDTSLYKRYVNIGHFANHSKDNDFDGGGDNKFCVRLIQQSVFSLDSIYHVTPPTVSRRNKDIYMECMKKGLKANPSISNSSKTLYQKYMAQTGIVVSKLL